MMGKPNSVPVEGVGYREHGAPVAVELFHVALPGLFEVLSGEHLGCVAPVGVDFPYPLGESVTASVRGTTRQHSSTRDVLPMLAPPSMTTTPPPSRRESSMANSRSNSNSTDQTLEPPTPPREEQLCTAGTRRQPVGRPS